MVIQEAGWSIALGIVIFIIGIIVSMIYYFAYKKLFLISYIASISTYIFSVFYMLDVYNLNKNYVLLILFLSSILMIFLGKYFSKFKLKKDKLHTSLKEIEIK